MSIILQNSQTRRFVTDSKTSYVNWSHNQKFAAIFSSGVEAFDFCRVRELANMNIILIFGEVRYQVEVPVRNRLSLN